MSRISSAKRMALDVVTMQQRSMMRFTKRSVHESRWLVTLLQQNNNYRDCLSTPSSSSSSWVRLHCKHSKNGRVSLPLATSRTIHTTSCPSGTGSHILYSTRWGRFTSQDDARRQVAQLSAKERGHLERAIEDVKKRNEEKMEREIEPPSWNQLKLLCYQNALPFIGFGFLDNVIMICVGEYIDTSIGVTLGISTMAAAGIGNMISDLAGLGLADQVEALCRKLGIPNPNLSSAQLRHRSSRWMGLVGRCVGIVIGCTIGMAPLLWFDDKHKDNDSSSASAGGGEQ